MIERFKASGSLSSPAFLFAEHAAPCRKALGRMLPPHSASCGAPIRQDCIMGLALDLFHLAEVEQHSVLVRFNRKSGHSLTERRRQLCAMSDRCTVANSISIRSPRAITVPVAY